MTAFAKTRAGSPSKTPAPMSSRDAASDTRNRARRTRTRPFRETKRCPCTEYTSSEKTMNKAAVFVNPLSPANTSNRGQRDSWEQEDRTTGGRGKPERAGRRSPSPERINAPYGERVRQRAGKEALKMRIALFDLDGTLIQGQSYAHLLRWRRAGERPSIGAHPALTATACLTCRWSKGWGLL